MAFLHQRVLEVIINNESECISWHRKVDIYWDVNFTACFQLQHMPRFNNDCFSVTAVNQRLLATIDRKVRKMIKHIFKSRLLPFLLHLPVRKLFYWSLKSKLSAECDRWRWLDTFSLKCESGCYLVFNNQHTPGFFFCTQGKKVDWN